MAERVGVLGAVELRDPVADAALGRGMARELLGFLVARRQEPAPTQAIIDALWPDAPPATVATIVHGLVRRLRQALGPDAVVNDGDGYRLALAADEVDLWIIDALLGAGSISEARERWREPAFGRYATRPWALEAIERALTVLRPDAEVVGLLRTRKRVPVSRLVGRRQELAAVANASRRSRLVSIVGLGGVGKTRLALEVVRQLDQPHVDFVDIGATVGPAASRLATELGLAASGEPELDLRAAASLVGRRRQVLLLDGCEHDTSGAAEVVEFLLGWCPELTVLATSRSPLGVPGEHVVPLLPFAHPDDQRGDSVELLLDRAHSMGVALSVEDRARAAEICRRCAGVPLAIELGVTELVFGLPANAHISQAGTASITPEEAVTAVVAQALSQLSPSAAQTARRAAVLVAGITPELGAALQGEGAGAPTGVLHELVASGLVVAETSGSSRRLRFLDRVRDALAEEADVADHAAAVDALRRLFDSVRAELAVPIALPRLVRAIAELGNAQGLLDQLRSAGRGADHLRLATAVADTWAEDGHWASGSAQMARAFDEAPDADALLRARAIRAWGAVTGTYAGARRLTPLLVEASEVARSAGDLALEAHLRLHAAHAYGYDGQLANAFEQVQRLTSIGRELDSEYVQIGAASLDGMGRMLTGDAAGARTVLADLARRLEGMDALSDAARLNRSVSLACRATGDAAGALHALERAERLALAGHARGTLATVRTDIADLRVQQQDPTAVDSLRRALEADLAVGNLRAAGIIRTRLGELDNDPATLALGVLDLWHADRQWAAAALATLLDALPDVHPLQRLGPAAIAALSTDWGTPLGAHESARVAPYLARASTPSKSTGWKAEVERHLSALATSTPSRA